MNPCRRAGSARPSSFLAFFQLRSKRCSTVRIVSRQQVRPNRSRTQATRRLRVQRGAGPSPATGGAAAVRWAARTTSPRPASKRGQRGDGRRCGGRPGRQVRVRCRRAASPSRSAGAGPRARRRAWHNSLARSRGAPGSARGCAGGTRPSPAGAGPPASGPSGHGQRTTWRDSAPSQAGTRRPHPTPSLAENYGPQTGRGLVEAHLDRPDKGEELCGGAPSP